MNGATGPPCPAAGMTATGGEGAVAGRTDAWRTTKRSGTVSEYLRLISGAVWRERTRSAGPADHAPHLTGLVFIYGGLADGPFWRGARRRGNRPTRQDARANYGAL